MHTRSRTHWSLLLFPPGFNLASCVALHCLVARCLLVTVVRVLTARTGDGSWGQRGECGRDFAPHFILSNFGFRVCVQDWFAFVSWEIRKDYDLHRVYVSVSAVTLGRLKD